MAVEGPEARPTTIPILGNPERMERLEEVVLGLVTVLFGPDHADEMLVWLDTGVKPALD